MSDLSLFDQGLALQKASRRPSYGQKGYACLDLGAMGERNIEIHYTHVPAFGGMPDEPPYGEHIEIHSAYVEYVLTFGNERQTRKLDVTELVNHDDKFFEAIQEQILEGA